MDKNRQQENNISFVLPVYNGAKTLKDAIDSILNGNFQNGDEIIVINDGSTDNTEEIIDKIKKKHNIIVINNEKNIGCPASRNVGIRNCKNSLIFNLDADNILEKDSISKLKKELLDNNVDVAAFQEYYYFKQDKNKITHRWVCVPGLFTLEDLLSGQINPGPGGNFLYKKTIWNKVGGYWEYGKGLHEAWGFTLKILANNAKFMVIPNTYYYHRYSHQSLFIRENKKENEGALITNKFIDYIQNMIEKESIEYINKNKDWFINLDKKPIKIKGKGVGKNGIVIEKSKFKMYVKKIFNKYLNK